MGSEDSTFWVVGATILLGLTFVAFFFGKTVLSNFSRGHKLIMGNWSSNTRQATGPPRLTKCPTNIKRSQVNDAVYEFYAPRSGIPDVEIVFFHGLQVGDYQDAFWKTWLSGDGSVIWPEAWLSQMYPNARMLAVMYDSSARTTATTGRGDMYNIGENLCNNLVLNSRANVGQNCPVVLVGHSLGGLAIKEFVLSCKSKRDSLDPEDLHDIDLIKTIDTFIGNLVGVFYYGTPHAGSTLADFATKLPGTSPILSVLKTLNKDTARRNELFEKFRKTHKVRACTIAEALPTGIRGFNAVVVTEASARPGSDTFSTAEKANHFTVCKPEAMTATRFQALDDFIFETLPKGVVTHKTSRDLVEDKLLT